MSAADISGYFKMSDRLIGWPAVRPILCQVDPLVVPELNICMSYLNRRINTTALSGQCSDNYKQHTESSQAYWLATVSPIQNMQLISQMKVHLWRRSDEATVCQNIDLTSYGSITAIQSEIQVVRKTVV